MDFKQLEAFVYVVKLKSFSKAAQRIYLTQPTISAHINSLEKELDTKLIERGTKYVYPTKPGSILYQYAVKMLNLRDDACCSVKNYNKELKGTLSICASTVPSQYILPKVVSAFREEYPHVTFNIQRQDSELVVENIAKGMADHRLLRNRYTQSRLRVRKLHQGPSGHHHPEHRALPPDAEQRHEGRVSKK